MTITGSQTTNPTTHCPTPGCKEDRIPHGRWCGDCTRIVWRTGRPPELLEPVRLPEWRKRSLARDETGWTAA